MAGSAAPDQPTRRQNGRARGPYRRRRYWRTTFLRALAEGATAAGAMQIAGVSSSTAYDHRKADPAFAAAWDNAAEAGLGVLENELVRRAVDGVLKPDYYKGEVVGYTRHYSDRNLLRALAARNPAWAERSAVAHEHSGRIAHAVEIVARIPCNGRDPALCQTCGGKGCEQARAFEATFPAIEHDPAALAPTAALAAAAAGAAPAPAPLARPARPAAAPVSTPQTGKRTL